MRNLLTPWLVLPAAAITMALVTWQAIRLDCARIDDEHDEQVQLVDAELRRLETRYFKQQKLPTGPQAEADPTSAYAAAATPDERHFIFRRLAEPTARPGDTGPRRNDEAAGIFNRWQILERDYRAMADEREAFRKSWRGKIASKSASASDAAN